MLELTSELQIGVWIGMIIFSLIMGLIVAPRVISAYIKKPHGVVDEVVEKSHKKFSASVKELETKVDSKITMLETTVNARVNDVNVKIADISGPIVENMGVQFDKIKIPENIPDMASITKLIEDGRENTLEVLNKIEKKMTDNIDIVNKNMQQIDANIPSHIETGIKRMEGRAYRAQGIDQADNEKGLIAAKQVMIEEIQNPGGNKSEGMQIVRHFVDVAAKQDLIDPENADQVMGTIQGIIQGIEMIQNRKQTANSGGGGFLSAPITTPSIPSQGSEIDNYYR